jgi:hypothetical protein
MGQRANRLFRPLLQFGVLGFGLLQNNPRAYSDRPRNQQSHDWTKDLAAEGREEVGHGEVDFQPKAAIAFRATTSVFADSLMQPHHHKTFENQAVLEKAEPTTSVLKNQ